MKEIPYGSIARVGRNSEAYCAAWQRINILRNTAMSITPYEIAPYRVVQTLISTAEGGTVGLLEELIV